MKLTCAIIDDEPLAISLLESYVNKTPFLELAGKYNNAVNALPMLTKEPVDLLFLDIQMPELNGMEFSRILEAETRIIFTTAFSQYALDCCGKGKRGKLIPEKTASRPSRQHSLSHRSKAFLSRQNTNWCRSNSARYYTSKD